MTLEIRSTGQRVADCRAERRDAAANRARILAAARRLLREEGIGATSIDRIAAEAGVGKGTVFRRFGDRAGLTAALLDENMRGFQEAFLRGPPPLGPGAPPAARLEAFVDAFLVLLDEDLEVILAAEQAVPCTGSAVGGALRAHASMLIAEIDPGTDPGLVADLLLGAVAPAVVARMRAAGGGLAAQQASARVLLRGLTAPVPAT